MTHHSEELAETTDEAIAGAGALSPDVHCSEGMARYSISDVGDLKHASNVILLQYRVWQRAVRGPRAVAQGR